MQKFQGVLSKKSFFKKLSKPQTQDYKGVTWASKKYVFEAHETREKIDQQKLTNTNKAE